MLCIKLPPFSPYLRRDLLAAM